MKNRTLVTIVAGIVVGVVGVAAIAFAVDGRGGPSKLRVVAGAAAGRDEATSAAAPASASAKGVPVGGSAGFTVKGPLPPLPDHAHAWRVDPPTKDDAVRIARALGLSGDPTGRDGRWIVRDGDRGLSVDPQGSWFYSSQGGGMCADDAVSSDGSVSTGSCAGGIGVTSSGTVSSGTVSSGTVSSGGGSAGSAGPADTGAPDASEPTDTAPSTGAQSKGPSTQCGTTSDCPIPKSGPSQETAPEPPGRVVCPPVPCPAGAVCSQACPITQPQPRPANLPSSAEAERIARDLVGRLGGRDLVDVQVDDGFDRMFVGLGFRIGGLPTVGPGWNVTVGPNSTILDAAGITSTPSEGDDYPLIGVDRGLERLKDQGVPVPMKAQLMPDCAPSSTACPPVPEPEPTVITGVHLVLVNSPASGGGALFLPAYRFTIDGGDERFGPVVVALDEKYLEKVEPRPDGKGVPEPAPVPAPRPLPAQSVPAGDPTK